MTSRLKSTTLIFPARAAVTTSYAHCTHRESDTRRRPRVTRVTRVTA